MPRTAGGRGQACGENTGQVTESPAKLGVPSERNDGFYCFVSPLSEVGRGGRWALGSQLAPERSHGTVTALGLQQQEPAASRSQGQRLLWSPSAASGPRDTQGREGWAQGGTYLLAVSTLAGEKSPFCPLYLASAPVPP